MTKFKQPIVFQSRNVIDLEEIKEHLHTDTVSELLDADFFSPAQYLSAYETLVKNTGFYSCFTQDMQDHFDIDITKLKYGKLPRPLALDNRTGDLYQVVSVDYSSSGAVTSVIVREGDTIKYIYNDLPQTDHITGMSYKTELILLHDGWY